MSFISDKTPSRLGFDVTHPDKLLCLAPAASLALAFLILPLCLLLPIDADRTLPLLLVPAVALGWKLSRPVAPFILALTAWALAAMLLSTLFAHYPARALVSASATFWVIAAGMTARNLAPCRAAVRLVLGGIALGAALGVVLVSQGAGLAYMDFPLYWGPRIFGLHQFAGAVAALYLFRITASRPWRNVGLALFVVLILLGLMTSGSRACLVGWGVFLIFWFWRGGVEDRRFLLKWTLAITVTAFLLAYLIGQPFSGDMGLSAAMERTATATSLEGLSSARSYFWSVVWHQGLNSPWIGHGADAYLYIQPRLHGSQPHNGLLQWFYEYGLVGVLPLGLLLLAAIAGAFRPQKLPHNETWSPQAWASAAVAGAGAVSLFDGAFYHMVVFMAVGLFVGFALGGPTTPESARPVVGLHKILRPSLLIALVSLLVHSWLGYMLVRAYYVNPDDSVARILRIFPSTTHGLRNWINRWEHTQPEIVMDWITWAQTATNEQPEYHLAAAQIYLNQHDFISAERELRACLPKVRDIEIPDVERLLTGVSAKAREQAAASQKGLK
jgi:O-antigen ligase